MGNQNKTSAEPFNPGIYILTGVNGIGKSTIIDGIAADHPETVPLHASFELRTLFNGITREELELLKPEEKMAKMVMHFTTIFEENLERDKAVLFDTHLLVPIRKEGTVVYEDIWSDAYAPYVNSMAMLSAEPSDIRAWRLRDEATTGRRRNTNIGDIVSDQNQNIARFMSLLALRSIPEHSRIIGNNHGSLSKTRTEIEEIFRASAGVVEP